MTSSSNSSRADMEGHSTNRPPLFDGINYEFWINRMSVYTRSCDYEMWEVIMDSPYMPRKTKRENGKLEPKLRSEWTDAEMKKVQINFKVINTFNCALNPMEFNRISTCESVKEI